MHLGRRHLIKAHIYCRISSFLDLKDRREVNKINKRLKRERGIYNKEMIEKGNMKEKGRKKGTPVT